jgi:hypothetical protein
MTDIDRIIAGLSEAQKRAVIDAATFLEHCADEGMGVLDNGKQIFSEDIVCALQDVLGLDVDTPIGLAVRARLQQGDGS